MDVYRKNPVPVIYTHIEFVRAPCPRMRADCRDDLPLLQQLQSIAAGHACVSVLECDSPHTLIVKAEFPDDILSRDGTSGQVIEWRVFQWKLWDAESLLTNRHPPAEAVHPAVAGIDPEFLESLADPSSCLKMLRETEDTFDSGTRKGYELHPETADAIAVIEKQLIARLNLKSMKLLKPSIRPTRAKLASVPQVSAVLRNSILQRGNYRCIFCGQDSSLTALEVNHVIPRSLINKLQLDAALHTAPENLCVTCFNCNRGKSDNLATTDIAYYRAAFSNPTHPNHSVLLHLTKISELQSL